MSDLQRFAAPIGRLLLIAVFFVSGVGKLAAPAATKAYIATMGLPYPEICLLGLGHGRTWRRHAVFARVPDAARGRRAGPLLHRDLASVPPQSRRPEPDAAFSQGPRHRRRLPASRGLRRRGAEPRRDDSEKSIQVSFTAKHRQMSRSTAAISSGLRRPMVSPQA